MVASVASWVIIFRKRSVMRRAAREAEQFEERFWSGAELSKLYAGSTERNRDISGIEAIFEAGFREFNRIRQRRGVDSRVQLEGAQRAMRATGSREIDGLEHNLELLANIGSNAPYVGLVGTVFGIMVTMHSLLASSEQVGIKDVAPGISEALLATAMGLFVAIPAVLGLQPLRQRRGAAGGALRRVRRGVLLDPAAPGAPRRAVMRIPRKSPPRARLQWAPGR